MVGIRAAKLSAIVVEAHPILRAARLESKFVRARVEPEIARGQFLFGQIRPLGTADFAAITAGALDVNAVVLAPNETVEQVLNVQPLQPGTETREHFLAYFGATVAIPVLEAPDVG